VLADERDLDSALRERHSGGQSDQAAADDDYLAAQLRGSGSLLS
jgi:hypothetical protein